MKKTPFKKIWTKEFLLKLKEKFVEQPLYTFFCVVCKEFEALWDDPYYRRHIRKVAKNYLKTNAGELDLSESKYSTLFNATYDRDRREIRLSFLDHEIARLTK